jgi:phenylpropionate dioxygenase-like ring-hydroxylating dioxygenase large terminal subunit
MIETTPSRGTPAKAQSRRESPPHAEEFADCPAGWYYFCNRSELSPGPLSREMLGKRLVAFCPNPEEVSVLDARCSHLGADLGLGSMANGCVQCPFHHWQYGADGRCTRIPASPKIPSFARQRAYPGTTMGPLVFTYIGPAAAYPALPFFPDENPANFRPSRPFSLTLDCPWYLVAANAFDVQHFRTAHDRELLAEPEISSPGPGALRIAMRFRVAGSAWRDRFIRVFSGNTLTMTVTVHGGTMVFVTARFRRTTTFGLVNVIPLAPERTRLICCAWVRRAGAGSVFDALHAGVRRNFIRAFVNPDTRFLGGCTYHPRRLIEADQTLSEYFTWLASLNQPVPSSCQ